MIRRRRGFTPERTRLGEKFGYAVVTNIDVGPFSASS